MKAIMYGAGSIGRGFIGALFSKIGYEVAFVDVNDSVISTLNKDHQYPQIIMNDAKDIHWITNVRGVDGNDTELVSDEIATADIMATAIGAGILKHITPIIANGLIKRWDKDPTNSIDLLICENLMDADAILRDLLLEALPEKYHAIMEEQLGLVETSIGRMVPPADENEESIHPLAVRVEPYDFLPVDKAAFKGNIPSYDKLVAFAPFHYYLERKLYIHNMAHVTTAFLGQLKGCTYIHDAAKDLGIRTIVEGCMRESAFMLSKKYNVAFYGLQSHMDDLLWRFQNPHLKDTVARVARDPIRKLQPSDRLVGAARSCEDVNVTPTYLSFAIALALHFQEPKDITSFLADTCHIHKNEPLYIHVLHFYGILSESSSDLKSLIASIDSMKSSLRGEIV